MTEAEPKTQAKALPKARRWRRRLIKGGLIALAALVVFRLALLILLPVAIGRTARALGFRCEYQRMKLSLLATNASLWGLTVTSRDGTQQLLKAEYANANISTIQLFRLRLIAWRLEADGVEIDLLRRADGSIPILEQLLAVSGTNGPARPAPPRAPDFSSPLEIRALRVHRLTLRVKDETLQPPFEDSIHMNLRVSDFGRTGVPVRVGFDATSNDLFGSAAVDALATINRNSLSADATFILRGLRSDRFIPYLDAIGVSADDRGIEASGKGSLTLSASTATVGALQGSASLSGLLVRADSDPVASLESAAIDIAELSPSALHLRDVQVKKGTLRAERTHEGRVRLAAFSARPGGAGRSVAPAPVAPPVAPPASASTSPPAPRTSPPFRWRIDSFGATDLAAVFDDQALVPRQTLALKVSEAEATDLRSEGPAECTAKFSATMAIPGVIGAIRATGTASPFLPEPSAHAGIEVTGIRPEALTPYLKPLGIESTLGSASLRFAVDSITRRPDAGPPRTTLTIAKVALQDQDHGLFEFGPVTVTGVAFPASGGLDIESIEGAGPAFTVRRGEDKVIEVLGIRFGEPPPSTSSAPVAAAQPAPSGGPPAPPGFHLPILRLGTLTWGGVKIRLEDAASQDGPIELTDVAVEVRDVRVAPPAEGAAPPAATITARLRSPGLIDEVNVTGTLAATTTSITTELNARSSGMSLARLAPYLKPLLIEPTMERGTLAATFSAGYSQADQGTRLTASARDVSLVDGEKVLLNVGSAAVDRVDFNADRIVVGPTAVAGFAVNAARDDAGLSIGGIKMLDGSIERIIPDNPIFDLLGALSAVGRVTLESVALKDARIDWSDSATKVPVSTQVDLSTSMSNLQINDPDPAAPPGTIELLARASGLAEELRVQGSILAGGNRIRVDTTCAGRGISTSLVAAYLPRGIEGSLDNGAVALKLGLVADRIDDTSVAGAINIREVDFRAAGSDQPLASAGLLTLEIGRFSPATGDLIFKRIAAEKLVAAAESRADGSLSALGFSLVAAPPAPPPPSAPPQPAPETPPPPSAPAAPPAATIGAKDVRAAVQHSQRPPPLVVVESIDLGIERVSLTGPPPAAPVAIVDTRLRTAESFRLLGPVAEENSPARITIHGKVEPVVGGFDVDIAATPFAPEPSLMLTVEAAGVNGAELTRVIPALAEFIDGTPLTDGRFKTSVEAKAKVQRRGPTAIDWSRGAEVTVTIANTEFRSGPEGPILAGVARVHAESVRLDPASGNATAREVEVEKLAGRAWRDESGVHILGMIVKPPAGAARAESSAPAPAAAGPAQPAKTESAQAEPAQPVQVTAPEAQPDPEIRINRLAVSGLDFRFEDRGVQPPVTIPLNALEAEFRGLSSLMFERERVVRFNLIAGAGKVTLPRADAPEGDTSTVEREFFLQCTANGTFVIAPVPRGRAVASISGVELLALRGIAQDVGASIGGGTFDGRVDCRAQSDGKVQARTHVVLTDLKYSEPEGGPVERTMALPVPINAAIAVVEAPDGTITVSPAVTLDEQGLTTGKLVSALAVEAGKVVAAAVVSAPVKIVAGFAGLGSDEDPETQWVELEPIALEYPDGVTALPSSSQAKLHALLERARSTTSIQLALEHSLGASDAALAFERANPPSAQAESLAAEVRRRRTALLSTRAELIPLASAWAVGVSHDPDARQRLRTINLELADLEDSMDQIYELQSPGAEPLKVRRARSAAVELIEARMAAVRRSVERVAGPSGSTRVAVVGGRPVAGQGEHSHLIVRVRERK